VGDFHIRRIDAEKGRKTIAKRVAGAMKIWYRDEYRDAGY
jgi:hypothetical protein